MTKLTVSFILIVGLYAASGKQVDRALRHAMKTMKREASHHWDHALEDVPGQLHSGDAPFLARVDVERDGQLIYCVGVIVTIDDVLRVLASTRCIQNPYEMVVVAGDVDMDKHSDEKQEKMARSSDRLSAIISGASGDLTALNLETPLDKTKGTVEPVPINQDENCPQPGDTCDVMGWGERPNEKGYLAGVPSKSAVTVVAGSACGLSESDVLHMCLLSEEAYPCKLNYNGPVVCKCSDVTKLVAMTLEGQSTCEANMTMSAVVVLGKQ